MNRLYIKDSGAKYPWDILVELFRPDLFGNVISPEGLPGSLTWFNIDHVWGYKMGGLTEPNNLIALSCWSNSDKTNFILNTCVSVLVEVWIAIPVLVEC